MNEAPRPMQEARPHVRLPELQQELIGKELGRFPDVQRWYTEGLASFPQMTVERGKASLGQGKGWQVEYQRAQDGSIEGVKDIANPAFFRVEEVEVGRDGVVTHTQPGLYEATKPVKMQTEYGEAELETSAYVGVILDQHGNMLAGLGQEPFADTPNHVIVKTPLQTSAGKFDLVFGDPEKGIAGDPSRDQVFFDTLQTIFPGDTREQFLAYLAQPNVLWPMGIINGNRLNSPNVAFVITVDDAQKETLTASGKSMWINQAEKQALERAGLMNTIASAAFSAAIPAAPQAA